MTEPQGFAQVEDLEVERDRLLRENTVLETRLYHAKADAAYYSDALHTERKEHAQVIKAFRQGLTIERCVWRVGMAMLGIAVVVAAVSK